MMCFYLQTALAQTRCGPGGGADAAQIQLLATREAELMTTLVGLCVRGHRIWINQARNNLGFYSMHE